MTMVTAVAIPHSGSAIHAASVGHAPEGCGWFEGEFCAAIVGAADDL
ncbi:MAG: hypothetical protein ACRDQ4_22075 [Pseudonocardiaceae bacterium]